MRSSIGVRRSALGSQPQRFTMWNMHKHRMDMDGGGSGWAIPCPTLQQMLRHIKVISCSINVKCSRKFLLRHPIHELSTQPFYHLILFQIDLLKWHFELLGCWLNNEHTENGHQNSLPTFRSYNRIGSSLVILDEKRAIFRCFYRQFSSFMIAVCLTFNCDPIYVIG